MQEKKLRQRNSELSESVIEDWLPQKKEPSGIWLIPSSYISQIEPLKGWIVKNYEPFKRQTPFRLYAPDISITLESETIAVLPYELRSLVDEIEKSKYILELEDDWDDEGSIGYKKETWIKSIKFIVSYAIWFKDNYNKIIEVPKIYHGPEGSIDISWENLKYRLLVNIPDGIEEPAMFYSDDYKMESIKGTFNPISFNQNLFVNLMLKDL